MMLFPDPIATVPLPEMDPWTIITPASEPATAEANSACVETYVYDSAPHPPRVLKPGIFFSTGPNQVTTGRRGEGNDGTYAPMTEQ